MPFGAGWHCADHCHPGVGGLEGEQCLKYLERLRLPMPIGVRADGRKELVAVTNGYPEATGLWANLLPAFYDFPTEHWMHLHTINPIQLTFAAVTSPLQDHEKSRITCGRSGGGLKDLNTGLGCRPAEKRRADEVSP